MKKDNKLYVDAFNGDGKSVMPMTKLSRHDSQREL